MTIASEKGEADPDEQRALIFAILAIAVVVDFTAAALGLPFLARFHRSRCPEGTFLVGQTRAIIAFLPIMSVLPSYGACVLRTVSAFVA